MSYDPTEWAPQTPGQQPAQPPVTPPAYGQAPQPPVPPAQGQVPSTQYAAQPPAYGQPQPPTPGFGQPGSPMPQYGQTQQAAPAYGQSGNPAQPPYGAPQQSSNPNLPPYGVSPQQVSNPGWPPYGAPPQQASNPGLPPYGAPPQASSPNLPPYGAPQASNPGLPPYGAPQQVSNPGLPPYGAPQQVSNPGLPPYGAPADPYAQPQPPQWGAAMPPGYIPPTAAPKKRGMKLWIIILVIIVVLGAGGGGIYVLTRPKPVITLSSKYMDGPAYVGAASTSFALTGSDFTGNSAITFLLDGKSLAGTPSVQSDSSGKVTVTLPVTSAWPVGTHTLTAQDASNYKTNLGVKVEIVAPGKSNTPGPNGAPTDTATITVVAAIQVEGSNATQTLDVKNGNVCSKDDDGQPHTSNGTATNGVAFTTTITSTCSGTYQGGKLTYSEMTTRLDVVYSDGLTCKVSQPFVSRHLDGTFTSATAISGAYSSDATSLNCNLGVGSLPLAAEQGTWTGVAAVS